MEELYKKLLPELLGYVEMELVAFKSTIIPLKDEHCQTEIKIKDIVQHLKKSGGYCGDLLTKLLEEGSVDELNTRDVYCYLAGKLSKDLPKNSAVDITKLESYGGNENRVFKLQIDNVEVTQVNSWPQLTIQFSYEVESKETSKDEEPQDSSPESGTEREKGKPKEFLTVNHGIVLNKANEPDRVFLREFREGGEKDHRFINALMNLIDSNKVEIYINSYGGNIDSGVSIMEILKDIQANVEDVKYFISGKAISMGALVFLSGETRVIDPHSNLMLHNYSAILAGKGGDIDERHKHSKKRFNRLCKELLVKPGFMSKDEFKMMKIGKDYWFGAKKMCKRGIATHVKVNGDFITAKEYLKGLK